MVIWQDVSLLGMYAVMDVGGPNASCKEQQLKGQEVHWHKEKQPAVRYRLQTQTCNYVLYALQ